MKTSISFKLNTIKNRPDVIFIQSDISSSLGTGHLVEDLRSIFGVITTIIIIGDEISKSKFANYLSYGVDQFFSFPFDDILLEDFLSKRTSSEYFHAFKYRNIPSGSTGVLFKFNLKLLEVNTLEIILKSDHAIKVGCKITLNLITFIPNIDQQVIVIVHSSDINEDDTFFNPCSL
jgi:hypothetical protein